MRKTKIVSVEIVVAGKTIKLTMDEAKELHEILSELFPPQLTTYIPSPTFTGPVVPLYHPEWVRDHWTCDTADDSFILTATGGAV